MNKTISINSIGILSFFAFLGIAVAVFFYKIGNINLAECIIASALLLALGTMSAVSVKNDSNNPTLKTAFKLVLLILSSVFALFVIGAVMLGLSD